MVKKYKAEKDLFNRGYLCTQLSQVLDTISQPFTMSIEASYGCGKTSFLDIWEEQLKERYLVVKINAWETDFFDEPLAPIASAFTEALDSEGISGGEKIRQQGFFKNIAAELTKKAISPVLDADKLEDKITTYAGKLQEVYKVQQSSYQAIRVYLEQSVEKLASQQRKKIVVLIDELDRCRPDYSVKFLEIIKHLFGINGIVFVLAIDRKQINSAIRKVYGHTIDADEYLSRFIDYSVILPKPDRGQHIAALSLYYNITHHEYDRVADLMMNKVFQFSLRTQERLYLRLVTFYTRRLMGDGSHALLMFMMCLFYGDETQYNRWVSRRDVDDMVAYLENKGVVFRYGLSSGGEDILLKALYSCGWKKDKTLELYKKNNISIDNGSVDPGWNHLVDDIREGLAEMRVFAY